MFVFLLVVRVSPRPIARVARFNVLFFCIRSESWISDRIQARTISKQITFHSRSGIHRVDRNFRADIVHDGRVGACYRRLANYFEDSRLKVK